MLDVEHLTLKSDRPYALVGPNGCGKSTLLRILSGVLSATSGSISVDGMRHEDVRVGYMPQKCYAFDFSVLDNIVLALKKYHLPKEEVRRRAEAALESVGLISMRNEKGAGLSGGEVQRLALARILVQNLDVILLDEPTASMDIEGTFLVEKALAKYRERMGCLMIAATHAPSQAHRIAEHAIMLASGKVVENGSVADVLERPKSAEGQAFLSYWTV